MAQYYSGPISQLPPAISPVVGNVVFPGTDPNDLTESPSGTTYKYTAAEIGTFIANNVLGSNIESVKMSSTANLTAVYNNGVDGVGATLVNTGADATLVLDGITALVDDRVLIKDQSTALQNGIYTVTVAGDGFTPWVLTRATDYNDSSRIPEFGDFVGVVEGNINDLTFWFQTTANPVTIGTSPLVFQESQLSSNTITWHVIPGTTQIATINSGYINQNAAPTTITLPAICAPGSIVRVVGANIGDWIFQANLGQTIQLGTVASSVAGTVSSTSPSDSLELVCTVANTLWSYASGQSLGYNHT